VWRRPSARALSHSGASSARQALACSVGVHGHVVQVEGVGLLHGFEVTVQRGDLGHPAAVGRKVGAHPAALLQRQRAVRRAGQAPRKDLAALGIVRAIAGQLDVQQIGQVGSGQCADMEAASEGRGRRHGQVI
jgi:hypothetical protein